MSEPLEYRYGRSLNMYDYKQFSACFYEKGTKKSYNISSDTCVYLEKSDNDKVLEADAISDGTTMNAIDKKLQFLYK
ncbi:hypothetical protein D7Z54_28520 [Salibacterium salarium]|uniref:Uncharacterized protein n=1 Tax=Salibacterium salarium TaxID=284579 RepID=A0A3R9P034_9BACI|nr:hypothetical protein [Salibacterium salarium]RSL29965.1 hypothetical protein D7Z54_28520 [Salibacterium salarium]